MRDFYRQKQSPIHLIDARVKLILTLAFVLALSLAPSAAWPAYLLFLTISLSAAVISRLGIRVVLNRAFLAIPFALAALPLVVTGPAPYKTFPIIHPIDLTLSLPGLERFGSIALKSWISIQAAIILTGTTRFADLMTALSQLGVPKLFVAIISLMWRYLWVISDEVTRMLRARSSRSTSLSEDHRSGGTIPWRARVMGGMVGSVFLRSLERSDRVFAAMLSRGYSGDLPLSEKTILSRKNTLHLALGLSLLTFLCVFSQLFGG